MKVITILACVFLFVGCAHKPKSATNVSGAGKVEGEKPPDLRGWTLSPLTTKDTITSVASATTVTLGHPAYIPRTWKRFVRARVRTIKTVIAYHNCKSVDQDNSNASAILEQCESIYDTTTEVSCADKTRIQLRADDGKWWCLSPGPEPMP